MVRIVEHDATGPLRIVVDAASGRQIHICRCGLSRSQPYCDGSHRLTRDEAPDRLVRYLDRKGVRVREDVEIRPRRSEAFEETTPTPGR